MRACIDGCHIMDGCVIGDHVRANGALICEGAVIHPGAVIEPGAVVSFNIVIGKGFNVSANARLSLCCQPEQGELDSSDDELEYAAAGGRSSSAVDLGGGDGASDDGSGRDAPPPPAALLDAATAAALRAAKEGRPIPGRSPWADAHVGVGGAGYRWEPRVTDDEWRYSIAPVHPSFNPDAAEIGAEDLSDDDEARGNGPGRVTAAAAPGAAAADDDSSPAKGGARARGADFEAEDDEEDEDEVDARELHFRREVAETFLRCVKEGFEQANAVVELQGLKMAENRSFADLARYILTTLLGLTLPAPPDSAAENVCLYPTTAPATQTALVAGLRPRLKVWAPLLRRFLKTEDDQVEMLLTFEEFAAEEAVFIGSGGAAFAAGGAFAATLHLLYDADVLSEEAAQAWAAEKAGADEADRRFVNLARPFFTWLEAASEASSSNDEAEDSSAESSETD
jgi:translation initiation factor eIF-2B subunit epsilon